MLRSRESWAKLLNRAGFLLPDPVTGETPDHTIGVYLLSAFGYTEKLPVYEAAPCTVLYDPDETPYTAKRWAAARADNLGRLRMMPSALEDLDIVLTRDAQRKITQIQVTDAATGKVATSTLSYDANGDLIGISKTLT